MYISACIHEHSQARLFATPWAITLQAPLSMGFPRQEYWSGQPFPTPEDLLDPEMELCLLALFRRFFPTELLGKPKCINITYIYLQVCLKTCAWGTDGRQNKGKFLPVPWAIKLTRGRTMLISNQLSNSGAMSMKCYGHEKLPIGHTMWAEFRKRDKV